MSLVVDDGSSLGDVAEAKRALGGNGAEEIRQAISVDQEAMQQEAVLDDASTKTSIAGDGAAAADPYHKVIGNLAAQAAGVGGIMDIAEVACERYDAAKGGSNPLKKMGFGAGAQTADQWAMKKTSQTLIDTESSKHGLGKTYRTGGNMLPGENDFSATAAAKKLQLTATRSLAKEKTQTLTRRQDIDASMVHAAERGVQGHMARVKQMAPGLSIGAGDRPKHMVVAMEKELDLSQRAPKGPTHVGEEDALV